MADAVLRRESLVCRRLFAFLAIQECAKILIPSRLCQHPRTTEKWRLMPHMLPMAAGQIGYPIPRFILMIGGDRLVHARVTMLLASVSTIRIFLPFLKRQLRTL